MNGQSRTDAPLLTKVREQFEMVGMDILAKAALTAGGVQGLCWIVVASGKVKAHQLSGLPYAAGVAAASFYGFSTCYPSAYRSSKLVVLLTACWAARLAGFSFFCAGLYLLSFRRLSTTSVILDEWT